MFTDIILFYLKRRILTFISDYSLYTHDNTHNQDFTELVTALLDKDIILLVKMYMSMKLLNSAGLKPIWYWVLQFW